MMEAPQHQVVEEDDHVYHEVICVKCGSGERDKVLLVCHKCDEGYHMACVKPIVARVPSGPWRCPNCTYHHPQLNSLICTKVLESLKCDSSSSLKMISPRDTRKRKRRTSTLVHHKASRRLLPYIPSKDADNRLQQMESLASALASLNLEFSNDLTYPPDMAPESANKTDLENGSIQVISNGDKETYNKCRAMAMRGEYPPLRIVFDQDQGYTVHADDPIKEMTLIAEYTGDVDYIKNREYDDSDSMMTLLLAADPGKSLVICPDKRGNIARFISGINNHKPESRKKINVKCVRYDVDGACRNILFAKRDIPKGQRLYYDYNGDKNEYPTQNFV